MSPAWRRTQSRFAFLHPDFQVTLMLSQIINDNNHGIGNKFVTIVQSRANSQLGAQQCVPVCTEANAYPKKQQRGTYVIWSELALRDNLGDFEKVKRSKWHQQNTARTMRYHSASLMIVTGWRMASHKLDNLSSRDRWVMPSIVSWAVIASNLSTLL